MKKYHYGAILILTLALSACSARSQEQVRASVAASKPEPKVSAQNFVRPKIKYWVSKDGEKIYAQGSDGKERLVISAKPHEGFALDELKVSPDGLWLMALASYPADGAGSVEQYGVLVNAKTGGRMDQSDMQKKYGVKTDLRDAEWMTDKPATLQGALPDGKELNLAN